MKNKKQGFSLVELVIVIAIMGVLLSVVAPFFLNYLGKSQLAACRENRDRLKKDMYNELIAFGKNDMEASAYLDEYMEKNGLKKVSSNTYEGICSTNGVVTFEIDGIDSAEAINISARCSVHGGDEVVVTEPEKEETGAHTYGPAVYNIDNSQYGYLAANKGYLINSQHYENLSDTEIANQYPFVSINGFVFGKNGDLQTQVDFAKELVATQGTALNDFTQELKNNIRNYYREHPSTNQPEKDLALLESCLDFSVENTKDCFRKVMVVSEIRVTLGELNAAVRGVSPQLKGGDSIPMRQYIYLSLKGIPNSALNNNHSDTCVLYGYRDTEVVIKNVTDSNKNTIQALLSKNTESGLPDRASVLDINLEKSLPELTKTEDWILLDKVDMPY